MCRCRVWNARAKNGNMLVTRCLQCNKSLESVESVESVSVRCIECKHSSVLLLCWFACWILADLLVRLRVHVLFASFQMQTQAASVHYYSLPSNSCRECFVEDTGEHCVVADGYGPPSCLVRCQPQGTLQSEPRTLLGLLPATSPCTLSPEGTKL